MEAFVIALFVVVVLVGIGLAVLAYYQAEQRKKELAAWAQARGHRFAPRRDDAMDSRYRFPCLNQGHDRYAYNILQGVHGGRPFCGFDYHYETYSTDSKGNRQTHHHYFSAVIVETNLPLKPLLIRTEGFFDKVGEFLGFDDIDFELAEFSREFYVKAADRRWAFDVLHQDTMEFLLRSPRFSVSFQDGQVIAYRNSTFAVADFESALNVMAGVLERLPQSVLDELKGTP